MQKKVSFQERTTDEIFSFKKEGQKRGSSVSIQC